MSVGNYATSGALTAAPRTTLCTYCCTTHYTMHYTTSRGVYVIIRDEIGITVDDDEANATSTELKNDNHRPFSFFGIFRSCSADSDSISTGINITHLHSIRFYMYSLRASLNTCITCWEF